MNPPDKSDKPSEQTLLAKIRDIPASVRNLVLGVSIAVTAAIGAQHLSREDKSTEKVEQPLSLPPAQYTIVVKEGGVVNLTNLPASSQEKVIVTPPTSSENPSSAEDQKITKEAIDALNPGTHDLSPHDEALVRKISHILHGDENNLLLNPISGMVRELNQSGNIALILAQSGVTKRDLEVAVETQDKQAIRSIVDISEKLSMLTSQQRGEVLITVQVGSKHNLTHLISAQGDQMEEDE